MIIIENVTIYKCEHCKKKYYRKHACEVHENGCGSNIENVRPCFNCVHSCKKTIDHYVEMYGSEENYPKEVVFCNKLDHAIYTPKVQAKGNAFDFGDVLNKPMPKECEHQSKEFENIF